MRDILILGVIGILALAALRRPWIGLMLWNWLSIMNPHRYAYDLAYNAPVAVVAAGCTMVGLLMSAEKLHSPFKGRIVTVFFVFMLWMTLSWLFGVDVEGDYAQWSKVMKINFMLLLAFAVLHTKQHIMVLAWVTTGSLALLGAKGGLFTLISGGSERVWGPSNSFIEDNNEFGLAVIMTIPMMRFLQLQIQNRWGRYLMTVAMILCAAATLGTHSRGALLAIAAMALLLWWRGKSRIIGGCLIILMTVVLLGFMPENWTARMNTIETYEQDGSALGRLAAWSNAWNLAFDYPAGVGFNAGRQELFDKYSYNPSAGARAAHSVYFQILGNHGFVGLGLYLALWGMTLRQAGWLFKHAAKYPQARWCADLGSMAQVSLIGFFVGGAFLSLAYFDLPYVIMVLVVLARVWVDNKTWETEGVAAESLSKVAPPLAGATRRA